jgi:anti-sigma factor RsiW
VSDLHAEVREELTALLDGALGADDRTRVEAHLAGCGPCRAEAERLRRTIGALAALPPAVPSPGFEQRFHARLARERSSQRGSGWRSLLSWRFLAPLGVAGAAAALVVAQGGGQRREQGRIAEHLDLLESYEVVASLGDVDDEDAEVVAHLDELGVRR